MVPTSFRVLRQDRSAFGLPTAISPSQTYKWSLQSSFKSSNLNMNFCRTDSVVNVITQFKFSSRLLVITAPSISLGKELENFSLLHIVDIWTKFGRKQKLVFISKKKYDQKNCTQWTSPTGPHHTYIFCQVNIAHHYL